MEDINDRNWNTSLKRRTQHYGYNYSYSHANTIEKTEPIPEVYLGVKKDI